MHFASALNGNQQEGHLPRKQGCFKTSQQQRPHVSGLRPPGNCLHSFTWFKFERQSNASWESGLVLFREFKAIVCSVCWPGLEIGENKKNGTTFILYHWLVSNHLSNVYLISYWLAPHIKMTRLVKATGHRYKENTVNIALVFIGSQQ